MKAVVIGSDSSGNCVALVDRERTILIDCGVSARKLCNLLPVYGIDPKTISHVLVTHEHGDHSKGVMKIIEATGASIFASTATMKALKHPDASLLGMFDQELGTRGLGIKSFPVPHDATDCIGFRIWMENKSIGYVTDAGYVTEHMAESLCGVETLFIEANHDKTMLRECLKHPSVKYRVQGYHGHLSNESARDLIAHLRGHGLNRAILCHLSKDANTPEMALRTVVANGVNIEVAKPGLVIEF